MRDPAIVLLLILACWCPRLQAQPRSNIVAGQVVDAGGHPVAGATVVLARRSVPSLPLGIRDPIGDPTRRYLRRRTGPDGRFVFSLTGSELFGLTATQGNRASRFTTRVARHEFVILRLEETGITGGTCRDADGAHRPGVTVHGEVPDPWGSLPWLSLRSSTRSSESGGYALRRPLSESVVIPPQQGDASVLRIHRPSDWQPGIDLVFGAECSWRPQVRGADGRLLAGAWISFDGSGERARTGPGGRVEMPTHQTGCVVVRAQGHAVAALWRDEGADGDGEIQLNKGLTVRCRILDPLGDPVSKGKVLVCCETPPAIGRHEHAEDVAAWACWQQSTDGAGRLMTSNVAPGRGLMLFVRRPDGSFDRLYLGATDRDADLGDLSLRHGITVSGQVRFADGRPAIGARVVLQPAEAAEVTDRDPGKCRRMPGYPAVCDKAGRFRFLGMRPGTYDVAAVTPGACEAIGKVVAVEGGSTVDLRFAPGEVRVVVPGRGGAVSGRRVVVAASDGSRYPLGPGGDRRRRLGLGSVEGRTDSRGVAVVRGLDPESWYRVILFGRDSSRQWVLASEGMEHIRF